MVSTHLEIKMHCNMKLLMTRPFTRCLLLLETWSTSQQTNVSWFCIK